MADLVFIVVLWLQAHTVGKGRAFMLSLKRLRQSVDNFADKEIMKKPTSRR
jgi:hypothetical protein